MPDRAAPDQEKEWQLLHDRITELLDRYGRKDPFGKGDYWLVDDNWGWNRQQLEIVNPRLLEPSVIKSLQALLVKFPDWEIGVCADTPAPRSSWPPADIIIRHDEIIDDLQRDYLPAQYRHFTYEGARASKKVDLGDKSHIFRRALK